MKLNYKEFGTAGRAVLIIHGLFGSLRNWQTLAKELSANFVVYTIDLRNHGRSPHSDEFDYQGMVEDIREFIISHELGQAILIGHSMGGKVAMQFAFDHPEFLEKLIVIDASPLLHVDMPIYTLEALMAVDVGSITSRKQADDELAVAIPDERVRQFLLGNLRRQGEHDFVWCLNLPVIKKEFYNILKPVDSGKTYTGPTLFVKGERSEYIEKAQFPNIQVLFSNAELIVIPNAGHWVHVDAPKELTAGLLHFLNRE